MNRMQMVSWLGDVSYRDENDKMLRLKPQFGVIPVKVLIFSCGHILQSKARVLYGQKRCILVFVGLQNSVIIT